MSKLKWTKSVDGEAHTYNKRFKITPAYWGTATLQEYRLEDTKKELFSYHDTQKQCKARAQRVADWEEDNK